LNIYSAAYSGKISSESQFFFKEESSAMKISKADAVRKPAGFQPRVRVSDESRTTDNSQQPTSPLERPKRTGATAL